MSRKCDQVKCEIGKKGGENVQENYKVVPIAVGGVAFRMRVPKGIEVAQLECKEEGKLRLWIDGKNVSLQLPLRVKVAKRRKYLRELYPTDEKTYFTLETTDSGEFKLDFRAPPPPCVGA